MLRNTLLCTLLLLCAAPTGFAQKYSSSKTKKKKKPEAFIGSELVAGYGRSPRTMAAGDLYGNANAKGAVSLTYRYHISKLLSLGLTGVFSQVSGERLQGLMATHTMKYWFTFISIAPEATFTYGESQDRMVRFYAAAGIGITYGQQKATWEDIGHTNVNNYINFAAHASPVGVRVGKKLGGFLELGIGYKGLVHGGVTYRFGQRQP